MPHSPFHTYAKTRTFAQVVGGQERLLAAYASANIKVFPYQIAAAMFALRSPHLKGVVLADEGSLGKTYEALLVASQMWLEGKTRQLLILPSNLVEQWVRKIEEGFTLPYVVWDDELPEEEESLIITTYDRAVRHADEIAARGWDLAIFDEADVLSGYENKTVVTLKAVVGGAFKLLLTPTPMKKDIMDIYGLIHFIDDTVLPDAAAFYKRYFRHPELYPELTKWVSPYIFRTLKSQVAEYVNFTERIVFNPNIELTSIERELYALVEQFISLPDKQSYRMEPWELSLMLFHSLSSSPQAFVRTIQGGIERAEGDELALLIEMQKCAESIRLTGKMQVLLDTLNETRHALKQRNLPQKMVVFTDNLTSLDLLKTFLCTFGHNVITTDQPDYADVFRYKRGSVVLIATDSAAKGLDFEFCPVVVNYDLLWNAIEMEQRIARCHRQGQQSDVLVVNLLCKENLADVRALELINKRVSQFDGIFGMSDPMVGNFDKTLDEILPKLRPMTEIAQAFEQNLQRHKPENKARTTHAEEMLFTTFTREVADKITLTPAYIEEKIEALNAQMWEIVREFFAARDDYKIDDSQRTATLLTEELPHLFYYWTGSRNRPYWGRELYGIGRQYRRGDRIVPLSPLVRGILHGVACADSGTVTVRGEIEPCKIGFYQVEISANRQEIATFDTLTGRTENGRVLSEAQCREILELPVVKWTEEGHKSAFWLKDGGGKSSEVDAFVPIEELKERVRNMGSAEEIDKIKLHAARQKSALEHGLDDLRQGIKEAEQALARANDRREQLKADKALKLLQRDLRQMQAETAAAKMRIEEQLRDETTLDAQELTVRTQRHFVVKFDGIR
jgi:hypothetical protein